MALKLDKSRLVRNLVTKTKFVTYLDRAIGDEEFSWRFDYSPKVGDTAWHPSGDCVPSPHELYLKATNQLHSEAPSVALRKAFMVGHFWHQYLQYVACDVLGFCEPAALERRGVRDWGEIEKTPFHWATGAGDIAPVALPKHGEYLIDFKTMAAIQFKQPRLPDWAADKYEAQINVYMDFFDLERALIVTVCKDSPHDMREHEYHRNQPLIDAIYQKWHLVSMCLDEGVCPPSNEEIYLPFAGPVV